MTGVCLSLGGKGPKSWRKNYTKRTHNLLSIFALHSWGSGEGTSLQKVVCVYLPLFQVKILININALLPGTVGKDIRLKLKEENLTVGLGKHC